MSVMCSFDQVIQENKEMPSAFQLIHETPCIDVDSHVPVESSHRQSVTPRQIPLISSSTIAVLEAPSTTERVARVADRIFSTISKTSVTLFGIFTGSILAERQASCAQIFPATAGEHLDYVARISLIAGGVSLAVSGIAGNIADKQEKERIKKCFEQMKKENENCARSIVIVHFPKQ